MRGAFGLVIALAVPSPPQTAPAAVVRMFCFTTPAEPTASVAEQRAAKERADSLKDFKEAVAKRKNRLQLVDTAEQADITVEILERRWDQTGRYQNTQYGRREITTYSIRSMVRSGNQQRELTGRVGSDQMVTSWRGAASSLADMIERWMKDGAAKR